MRPYVINQLLLYLKLKNEFYSDIEVNISYIPSSVIEIMNLDHEIPVKVDRSDQNLDLSFETDNEEAHNTRVKSEENPLDAYRIAANKTALINNSHFGDELTTIPPGEGNIPLSTLNDCHGEELAHPHLFLTGKFGYQVPA